jgi:hypothetical protein
MSAVFSAFHLHSRWSTRSDPDICCDDAFYGLPRPAEPMLFEPPVLCLFNDGSNERSAPRDDGRRLYVHSKQYDHYSRHHESMSLSKSASMVVKRVREEKLSYRE